MPTMLAHADDDAWRVAWLAGAGDPAHAPLVFTEADDPEAFRRLGIVPHPPTLSAMRSALAGRTGPLILFVAGHGGASGLHLDDGIYAFPAIVEALGPGAADRLQLVVLDACESGSWPVARAGDAPPRRWSVPPVDAHPHAWIEIASAGVTPELDELRGGLLTHWALSALTGAADANLDARVDAQELFSWIYAASLASAVPADPIVRARAPVDRAPSLGSGGTLRVGGDVPSRWWVSVHDGASDVVLVEAATAAGEERRLHLPAGAYTVWEAQYAPEGPTSWLPDRGATCDVRVASGGETSVQSCTRTRWLPDWLAGWRADAESPRDPVARYLDRFRTLQPTQQQAGRWLAYHSGPRPELRLAGVWSGASHPTGGVAASVMVGLRDGGPWRLGAGLGGTVDIGPGPVDGDAWIRGRVEAALSSGRTFQGLAHLEVGPGGRFAASRRAGVPGAAAPTVDLRIGLGARWMPRLVGFVADVGWGPRLRFLDGEDGLTEVDVDLSQIAIAIGPALRW